MQDQANHSTVFDIEEQQVAALYSKALLDAAGDRVDEIVHEFEAVVTECLDRFPKLEMALASPRIGEEEKQAMIDRIFGGQVDKLLLNFLKVLARRRRLGALIAIQKAASILRAEQLGRIRVIVSTALSMGAVYRRSRTYLDINSAAVTAFSRFSRDIRRASAIDLNDSVLAATPGRLTLLMKRSDDTNDSAAGLSPAAEIAVEHRLTTYDAAYVAAARRFDWRLVSTDVRDLVSKGLAITPDAAV